MKARYRIVGPHRVAGQHPGEVVDLSSLTDEQVAALVDGGHIAQEAVKKAAASASSDDTEEKES